MEISIATDMRHIGAWGHKEAQSDRLCGTHQPTPWALVRQHHRRPIVESTVGSGTRKTINVRACSHTGVTVLIGSCGALLQNLASDDAGKRLSC